MRHRRIEGWELRLDEFLSTHRSRPFQWGKWDCCLMAVEWIMVCSGVDCGAAFRGKYDDPVGALRCLRRFAGGGVCKTAEKLASENGFERVVPAMAQRGDVMLVTKAEMEPDGFGECLGVCVGSQVVVVTQDGLAYLPVSDAERAWRI